jgi:hypothetical protein
LNDPAQGVDQLVGDRRLWRVSKGKIFGRERRHPSKVPLPSCSGPARHIFDDEVNVAGPSEIVRKELGEGHLDCAVRGPAMTFGMIGRSFDGSGRVGGVLHAQGFKQFLTKDRIPIRSARGFGHNATGQKMRDVGIGESARAQLQAP